MCKLKVFSNSLCDFFKDWNVKDEYSMSTVLFFIYLFVYLLSSPRVKTEHYSNIFEQKREVQTYAVIIIIIIFIPLDV